MVDGKKVLIVEDELIIAADLQDILERNGFIVQSIATSPSTAVSDAELHKPDIILMDLQLNGVLTSWTLASKVLRFSKFGIIFISGLSIDENSHETMMNGCLFLSKPFNEQEIIDAIRVMMGDDL